MRRLSIKNTIAYIAIVLGLVLVKPQLGLAEARDHDQCRAMALAMFENRTEIADFVDEFHRAYPNDNLFATLQEFVEQTESGKTTEKTEDFIDFVHTLELLTTALRARDQEFSRHCGHESYDALVAELEALTEENGYSCHVRDIYAGRDVYGEPFEDMKERLTWQQEIENDNTEMLAEQKKQVAQYEWWLSRTTAGLTYANIPPFLTAAITGFKPEVWSEFYKNTEIFAPIRGLSSKVKGAVASNQAASTLVENVFTKPGNTVKEGWIKAASTVGGLNEKLPDWLKWQNAKSKLKASAMPLTLALVFSKFSHLLSKRSLTSVKIDLAESSQELSRIEREMELINDILAESMQRRLVECIPAEGLSEQDDVSDDKDMEGQG